VRLPAPRGVSTGELDRDRRQLLLLPDPCADLLCLLRGARRGRRLERLGVELYGRDLAERVGSAGYFLLARTTVLYLGCTLLYGVSAPLRIELLLWPLSLALAIGISGSLTYLACATAFWTEHARGPVGALVLIGWFLGGAVIPLDFYPDWLRLVCDLLPFRGALYTPVALAAGKLAGGALAFSLAHQVAWFGLLATLSRAVETRGVRRLVVHGG
jgi:ABC-2 type transport system permease protein